MDLLSQVKDTGNLSRLLQVTKPQFPDVEFVDLMGGRRGRRVGYAAAVKRVMAARLRLCVNLTHDEPPVTHPNLTAAEGIGIRKLLKPPVFTPPHSGHGEPGTMAP
jgi:hypothetical protein